MYNCICVRHTYITLLGEYMELWKVQRLGLDGIDSGKIELI